LNRRHTDFQSVALPTELPRHFKVGNFITSQVLGCPAKTDRTKNCNSHNRISPAFLPSHADPRPGGSVWPPVLCPSEGARTHGVRRCALPCCAVAVWEKQAGGKWSAIPGGMKEMRTPEGCVCTRILSGHRFAAARRSASFGAGSAWPGARGLITDVCLPHFTRRAVSSRDADKLRPAPAGPPGVARPVRRESRSR
jgi:hypothetical protein